MKFLFLSLMTLLMMNTATAEVVGCTGYYASKLEDVFTGNAIRFSQDTVLDFGSHYKDSFFQVFVDDRKDHFLVEVKSHISDDLLPLEETVLHPMVSFYSTENLKGKYKFPSDVPGAELGAVYLTFMCVR